MIVVELWRGGGGSYSLLRRDKCAPPKGMFLDCAIECERWEDVESILPVLLAVPPRLSDELPIVGTVKEVLSVKAEDYINARDPGGSGPLVEEIYHAASRIRHGKAP